VPIPQAFLWRLTGRIPTPIGRLTDRAGARAFPLMLPTNPDAPGAEAGRRARGDAIGRRIADWLTGR
jgi:hypothetical protein